jgi:hypothetical protein
MADTVTFVTLIALAMCVYPGGTAWDPATSGHAFWSNYLCDLQRQTALDGRANALGAALTQAALLVMSLGSLAFWHLMPGLFPARAALGRAARALGFVSCAGIVAVALLPSDGFPAMHPALMLLAGGPGIVAGVLGVVGLCGCGFGPALVVVGACAVLASAGDLALYLRQLFVTSPAPVAIAVLERVALLLALGWRVQVAWCARRRQLVHAADCTPPCRRLHTVHAG